MRLDHCFRHVSFERSLDCKTFGLLLDEAPIVNRIDALRIFICRQYHECCMNLVSWKEDLSFEGDRKHPEVEYRINDRPQSSCAIW